ncbi:sensor histidine kinase [Streptomyces sp. NPDC098789]|uniref:sensor histidine kinase n=1 Tax=Streptomyces sp. NPDC098789 TaxID=3366098 RepID=UPI00380E1CD7
MHDTTREPHGGGGGTADGPVGSGPGARLLRRARTLLRPELGHWPHDGSLDAISNLLIAHQWLALHRQAVLRMGLMLAASTEFLLFPPRLNKGATAIIMTVYACYTLVMLADAWRKGPFPHVAWAVPLVDLPAFALLLSVSGTYNDPNWENPFTSDWLMLVTILSAFQLRPAVTAVTGGAATVFFCIASAVGHAHAAPDPHFTIGHTLSLAMVSFAAVVLSRIQQSRVRQIAQLAHRRGAMLATSLSITERERRDMAEALHDGPLQSVLAARLDVDEAAEAAPHEALERADEALRDAARQLRSSVTELHPSVLERGGLQQALGELAVRSGRRGKFTTEVVCTTRSAGYEADRVLYNCAREFMSNVVKHAGAEHVVVRFEADGQRAWLSVSDDGVGLTPALLEQRVSQGHIGIASQQLRLQEVGGTLTVRPNTPTGTIMAVRLSLPLVLPDV